MCTYVENKTKSLNRVVRTTRADKQVGMSIVEIQAALPNPCSCLDKNKNVFKEKGIN